MKCALVGSRYFGALVFNTLRQEEGIEFTRVVAPAADDRLAQAAEAAGVPVHVLENPRFVPEQAIEEGTDLIIAAHTHARITNEALARARLGGVGYHPSLLPRHRGIAAVEWTILAGDPIAGGSVYHLADGWDAGAVAAQDWCFVQKGETARDLWERALAPMGLSLLTKVAHHARLHNELPAFQQDARFATKAPMIKKSIVLTEAGSDTVSVVATLSGADRQGIVSSIADSAKRHNANWTASRLARAAGEFAGMVHFEIGPGDADAFVETLKGLEAGGLKLVVTKSNPAQVASTHRLLDLHLVGEDRVGIVSTLTGMLVGRGISIETMQTEVIRNSSDGKQTFQINAQLLVPSSVSNEALEQDLGTLAHDMMLDIALGDKGLSKA